MTKIQIIKENKENYERLEQAICTMEGFEKAVAKNLTLAWIKGKNWLGGISDSEFMKKARLIEEQGYTLAQIDDEFFKQMKQFS